MQTLPKTKLGIQGLEVPLQGLRCMGMIQIAGSAIYGKVNESENILSIHQSLANLLIKAYQLLSFSKT